MYRPLLSICVAASVICSAEAFAQKNIGVGWSVSAEASGWSLQRVANSGERISLTCSPAGGNFTRYLVMVQSPKARHGRPGDKVELFVRRSPATLHYDLVLNGDASASSIMNESSFAKFLGQLNSLSLSDVVEVPRLNYSLAPANSDQETTFMEFKKLCHIKVAH